MARTAIAGFVRHFFAFLHPQSQALVCIQERGEYRSKSGAIPVLDTGWLCCKLTSAL